MTNEDRPRRHVLQATVGVAIATLAGCADTGDGGTNGTDGTTGTTDDSMGTTSATTDGGGTTTGEETTTEGTTTEDEATETTTTDGAGRVRVVHASPDAPAVDVYVDGEAALTDVPFGAISDYLSVPAGDRTVRITAAGDESTVAFEGTVTVQADTAATAVAFGNLTEDAFQVAVLADEPPSLDSGDAAVSLFHASPDAPPVDVTVESTGDPVFGDLAYGERSEYATVPAGSYTLSVRPASGGESVATFDVTLDGGTAYSAFAVGYLDPANAPADEPFDLLVAADTPTAMRLR